LSLEFNVVVIFPVVIPVPDMFDIGGIVQFSVCGTGQILPPFNGSIVMLIVLVL
jgi:hypothetical protein